MQHVNQARLLHPELDLNSEAGVLRIGPMGLRQAENFRCLLEGEGLTTGADEDIRVIPLGRDLAWVVVAGPEVTGYLMEDYGVTACCESLDVIVKKCVSQNTPISFDGHYYPDDRTKITSTMTAVHDGRKVSWSRIRARHRDGEQLRLSTRQDSFPIVDCGPADRLECRNAEASAAGPYRPSRNGSERGKPNPDSCEQVAATPLPAQLSRCPPWISAQKRSPRCGWPCRSISRSSPHGCGQHNHSGTCSPTGC